jgi:hypothetical protein
MYGAVDVMFQTYIILVPNSLISNQFDALAILQLGKDPPTPIAYEASWEPSDLAVVTNNLPSSQKPITLLCYLTSEIATLQHSFLILCEVRLYTFF